MNLTLIILLLLQENSSLSLKSFSSIIKEQDADSTFEFSPTHLLVYIIIVHDKF